MKKIFGLITLFAATVISVNAQNSADDAGLRAKMQKSMIPSAKVGSLMCEDANGNMIVCSGDEFEKVIGFATSTPYVTVNKRSKGENQDTFDGFASGEISVGDYVSAGPNGTVKRCDNVAFAYGKADRKSVV